MGLLTWLKKRLIGNRAAESHTKPLPPELQQLATVFTEIQDCLQAGDDIRLQGSCGRLKEHLDRLAPDRQDADTQVVLGDGYLRVGHFYQCLKRHHDAEQAYRSAMAIWEPLYSGDPMSIIFATGVASCHNQLGLVFMDTDRLDEAEAALKNAQAIWERMEATYSGDRLNLVHMGGTLCNLGYLAKERGDFAAALELYERSIGILRSTVAECETGPQDGILAFVSPRMGGPHLLALAHEFLGNALRERTAIESITNDAGLGNEPTMR